MAYLGNPQNTIEILKKYDFSFQKKYGQNFLIDTHVLDKIIRAAEITADDFVLEIGPGIGTMTQYLAEAAREVAVVEIDDKLIPILEETLKEYENVTIIHGDILKVDIEALTREKNQGRPVKVVANLPYYITTPIIMGLLEGGVPVDSITVMVQKEVADRMKVGRPVLCPAGNRGECPAELFYPPSEGGLRGDSPDPPSDASCSGEGRRISVPRDPRVL